jgi:hypothetical protein
VFGKWNIDLFTLLESFDIYGGDDKNK